MFSLPVDPIETYQVKACDVTTFSIVYSADELMDPKRFRFKPKFMGELFPENEIIEGYIGLKIDVTFSGYSFKCLMKISYDKKLMFMPSLNAREFRIVNVSEVMLEFLPDDCTEDEDVFRLWLQQEANANALMNPDCFRLSTDVECRMAPSAHCPDGTLLVLKRFKISDLSGVCGSIHSNIECMLPFFIEFANKIDRADPNWIVYLLFQDIPIEGAKMRVFVGMVAAYSYFGFPSKQRFRISQVLVLPIAQHAGRGFAMVKSVIHDLDKSFDSICITIESPNAEMLALWARVLLDDIKETRLRKGRYIRLGPHGNTKRKLIYRTYKSLKKFGNDYAKDPNLNKMIERYAQHVQAFSQISNSEVLEEARTIMKAVAAVAMADKPTN